MISVAHGLGTHSYELPEWEVSLNARLSLFKSEFYVWSVTSIKLSVAFMLIRIRGESKLWSRGLIAIMIVLVSLAITCSVIDYTHCRPVRALWDFSYPRSTCDPPSFIRIWQIPTSCEFSRSKCMRLPHLLTSSRQSHIHDHRRDPRLTPSAFHPTSPTSLARESRDMPAHGPWPSLRHYCYT